MSVEAVWDLQAVKKYKDMLSREDKWNALSPGSPRCMCVYMVASARTTTTNPFDTQQQHPPSHPPSQPVAAVVIGTANASLHYRTYPLGLGITATTATGASSSSPTSSSSSTNIVNKTVVPLGRGRNQQIPRHFFPMDLQSLPGPVVSVICTTASPSTAATTTHRSPSSQQQLQQQQTFLLLIDDGRGSVSMGNYTSMIVTSSLTAPGFQVIAQKQEIRMSCAVNADGASSSSVAATAVYYGAGRKIYKLDTHKTTGMIISISDTTTTSTTTSNCFPNLLPSPGIRSGQDALAIIGSHHSRVAVAAVGNSFYAVTENKDDDVLKIASFQQSSQVHPVIIIDLRDTTLDADWSSLFLASGRECAVVDVYYCADNYAPHDIISPSSSSFSASKPRNGTVTTASPILAAAAVSPCWVAVLTSDGLISIRSPSCLAIPLRTVEVGQRPNDYFVLRTLHERNQHIVAAAYSGECKVLQCHADTAQDLADRLMRHAIDAFGANGFPRSELAQAINASFTATSSYVGPSASSPAAEQQAGSPQARLLLKQYLEAVLGLADFESGGSSSWPTEFSQGHPQVHHGTFGDTMKTGSSSYSGRGAAVGGGGVATTVSSSPPAALLTATALLCLVCSQLSPPNSVLANRAAKSCSEKMGVVFDTSSDISKAAIQVCEMVAEKLLREASSNFSLLSGSSPTPITRANNRSSHSNLITDFIEAAIWLLRSCGKHERAIEVASERLQQQQQQHGPLQQQQQQQQSESSSAAENVRGVWSQIKYESYTATHLSEIWSAGKEEGCRLVLSSPVTQRLLENNPRLGLSVFTSMHPQNESQWRSTPARDDPLAHVDRVYKILELLKSTNPAIPSDKDRSFSNDDDVVINNLPLESGRAMAVSFLWSAIGISSGRPADDDEFDNLPVDADYEEHVANFHDELSFLLLEGVILERPEDDKNEVIDTELGRIYRSMLRELLKWPLAKIRSEHFMESLPPTFLEEKALVLGRIGRHDDALQILYRDLQNLDLALEYCDDRHAQQKEEQERLRARQQKENIYRDTDPMLEELKEKEEDNAYLPLIRVALESEDTERGTATAIKVLALRRSAIDRAAALRLLPSEVPVSAVARPFLIPALVESESQVRRMTVVSALLRSRYLRLKDKLTTAQLRAQANIHVVPALRSLNLGDPLHSTKSFRARTSSNPSPTMPDVQIIKHFFPRHLVIQAKVTNVPYSTYPSSSSTALYAPSMDRNTPHQTMLSDIAFVVAESSEEEAIQPLLQVPIPLLPPKMTGSAWCVLSASPNNMDGSTAQLTCELRYSVQSVDAASSVIPAAIGSTAMLARTYVEELQDLEVHAAHFS